MLTKKDSLYKMYSDLKNHKSINLMSREPIWLIAFADYNTENNNKFTTNCGGCYMKVYLWIKNKLENAN